MADILKFRPTFRSHVRFAAESGLLAGIKYTLALAIPLLILWFLVGDYVRVRADATFAADVIRRSISQQQAAQALPGK